VHPNHCTTLVRAWQTQMHGSNGPVTFVRAHGLGRLWTLEAPDLHMVTYAGAETPGVLQAVQVTNGHPHWLDLEITFALGTEARVELLSGGTVEAHGAMTAALATSVAPLQAQVEGTTVQLRYPLNEILTLCLVDGDGPKARRLLANTETIRRDAEEWAGWLSRQVAGHTPEDAALITAGLACAHASFKAIEPGFQGFFAGPGYTGFPRIYFRDGYWTAQVVLPTRPDAVATHLLALSRGVRRDGHCPSGVYAPGWAGGDDPDTLAWLPDHLDSPAFYVMLAYDYVRTTGDLAILDTTIQGWTVWDRLVACLGRLIIDAPGGLLHKDDRANDWADNVIRSPHVTYDQALYYRALLGGAALAHRRGLLRRAQRQGLCRRFCPRGQALGVRHRRPRGVLASSH